MWHLIQCPQEILKVKFETNPNYIEEVIQINVTATRWENQHSVFCFLCVFDQPSAHFGMLFSTLYFPQWQWGITVHPGRQHGAHLHPCEVWSWNRILSVSSWTCQWSRLLLLCSRSLSTCVRGRQSFSVTLGSWCLTCAKIANNDSTLGWFYRFPTWMRGPYPLIIY